MLSKYENLTPANQYTALLELYGFTVKYIVGSRVKETSKSLQNIKWTKFK